MGGRALSAPLIRDAVTHPIPITVAVFTSGLLFKWARPHIGGALVRLRLVAPLPVLLAVLLTALALLSSVITAIIASLMLVEMIGAVRIHADDRARLVVVACVAIGLGAALTPIGEAVVHHRDGQAAPRLLVPDARVGSVDHSWDRCPRSLDRGAAVAFDGPMLTQRREAETYRGVLARPPGSSCLSWPWSCWGKGSSR